MGGQTGQSTTTVQRWPAYLNNPEDPNFVGPNLPIRYVLEADATSSNYLNILSFSEEMISAQPVEETSGISNLSIRGRSGNVTIAKGKAHAVDVLEGDYLDGSIFPFQIMVAKADAKAAVAFTDDILPKIGATLYVIGDPVPANLAIALVGDTSVKYRDRAKADVLAKNYEFERGRQVDALPNGIEYSGQEIADAEMVRRAGIYAREYRQSRLEDDYRKKMEHDLNLIRAREVLGNALRSLVGTQKTITTPYHRPNPAGAIIGGVVGGVGGFMVGGPMGAAMGASLGMQAGNIVASG